MNSTYYCIKPLEKKSICWHIEMFRKNADGTTSWFNIDDHYRWGKGFIFDEFDLPYDNDAEVCASTSGGSGAELDDQYACFFDFSDDIAEHEKAQIKQCYLSGNGDATNELSGAAWLLDSKSGWEEENEYLVIAAPFAISLHDATTDEIIDSNVVMQTPKSML